MGLLERGQQAPSPSAKGSGGVLRAAPVGFRVKARPPKGFPLFSPLRMATPDNVVNCGSQKNLKFLIPFNIESILGVPFYFMHTPFVAELPHLTW